MDKLVHADRKQKRKPVVRIAQYSRTLINKHGLMVAGEPNSAEYPPRLVPPLEALIEPIFLLWKGRYIRCITSMELEYCHGSSKIESSSSDPRYRTLHQPGPNTYVG